MSAAKELTPEQLERRRALARAKTARYRARCGAILLDRFNAIRRVRYAADPLYRAKQVERSRVARARKRAAATAIQAVAA